MTEAARAPDFKVIRTGLHIAALLGMPLPIGGRQVEVPAGFRVEPSEIVEDGTPDIAGDAPDVLIVARDCAYLMRCAALEIERLGLDIGALQPPQKPERRPAAPLTALGARVGSSVPQPPTPEPAVIWVGEDEWHVGGTHALRASGPSWYVVALPNHLVGWFPNHDQARAAAIEAAKAARSRGFRPQSWQPFTHQHVVDRGGPGEMSATGRPAPKVITRRPD